MGQKVLWSVHNPPQMTWGFTGVGDQWWANVKLWYICRSLMCVSAWLDTVNVFKMSRWCAVATVARMVNTTWRLLHKHTLMSHLRLLSNHQTPILVTGVAFAHVFISPPLVMSMWLTAHVHQTHQCRIWLFAQINNKIVAALKAGRSQNSQSWEEEEKEEDCKHQILIQFFCLQVRMLSCYLMMMMMVHSSYSCPSRGNFSVSRIRIFSRFVFPAARTKL